MSLIKKRKSYLTEYLILVFGLLVVLALFILFNYSLLAQILISILGSAFYIAWGIIHHASEGRMDRRVVLEYVFFGIFVLALFLSVLTL
jgi:hypothetical protein